MQPGYFAEAHQGEKATQTFFARGQRPRPAGRGGQHPTVISTGASDARGFPCWWCGFAYGAHVAPSPSTSMARGFAFGAHDTPSRSSSMARGFAYGAHVPPIRRICSPCSAYN